MTEPMREGSCGRCRALDLVVTEKNSIIQAKEAEIERLSKSFVDMKSIADCTDIKLASLRTLVKELGDSLAEISLNLQSDLLREGRDPIQIAEEALLLIPEELRKP